MGEALETHLQRQVDHSGRFFWHRLRWRAVRNHLPQAGPFTLVDVGAGAGLLADYLAKDRPEATYRFVEPIDSLRTMLRDRHGSAADVGDDERYKGTGYVTLLDVLEHQEDDRSFMRELVSKMEPGSVLIVTVPAMQKLWSPWDVALGHFRRYDKVALEQSVEGLPVHVDEVSYLFPEMVPLGWWRARKGRSDAKPVREGDAEFPDLPNVVNDAVYGAGLGSLALRRRWPVGTSLLMAVTIE
jgi:hypothetical protein